MPPQNKPNEGVAHGLRQRQVALLCVPLRAQPGDFAVSLQPVIDIGFARQAGNVSDFCTGIVGFDLPIAFCDPLRMKGDARGFAHASNMEPFAGIR